MYSIYFCAGIAKSSEGHLCLDLLSNISMKRDFLSNISRACLVLLFSACLCVIFLPEGISEDVETATLDEKMSGHWILIDILICIFTLIKKETEM